MSRTNLEDLNAKEKDNRWLQLPICPRLLGDPSNVCGEESSSSCEDYAHPSPKVLSRNKLKNGFVVCCHDFVFRHSGKGGCFKKEDCIYYHPTNKRQEMMVRIAGKVNKDIKMLYSQRLAAEQQRLLSSAAAAQYPAFLSPSSSYTHPYFYASPESTLPYVPPLKTPGREEEPVQNNRKRQRLDNEVCSSGSGSGSSPTPPMLQPSAAAANAGASLAPLSLLPLQQGQQLGILPYSAYFGLNYGMYHQHPFFPSN